MSQHATRRGVMAGEWFLALLYAMTFAGLVVLAVAVGTIAFGLLAFAAVAMGVGAGLVVRTDEGMLLPASVITMLVGFAFFAPHGGWVFWAGLLVFWAGAVAYGLGTARLVRKLLGRR